MSTVAKRIGRAAVVLALMVGATAQAKADQILVFDASGSFDDGATLSGNVTIDVTSGTVTAVDLVVGTPDSLTFAFVQTQNSPLAGDYQILAGTSGSGLPHLDLILPTSTLVGYQGGTIGSGTQPANNIASEIVGESPPSPFSVGLTQGSLSVATREPSTLAGAATGVLMVAGYAWRKWRKRRMAA